MNLIEAFKTGISEGMWKAGEKIRDYLNAETQKKGRSGDFWKVYPRSPPNVNISPSWEYAPEPVKRRARYSEYVCPWTQLISAALRKEIRAPIDLSEHIQTIISSKMIEDQIISSIKEYLESVRYGI